jgi:hypothetical protein
MVLRIICLCTKIKMNFLQHFLISVTFVKGFLYAPRT